VPGDGGTRAVADVVLQRSAADVRTSSPADVRQDDDDSEDHRSRAAGHRRLHVQGDQRTRRRIHQDLPASQTYDIHVILPEFDKINVIMEMLNVKYDFASVPVLDLADIVYSIEFFMY